MFLPGPFYVIVEYCEHGALRSYLREIRQNECGYLESRRPDDDQNGGNKKDELSIRPNDLLSFAWQIAKGMQYLSEMKVSVVSESANDWAVDQHVANHYTGEELIPLDCQWILFC